MSQVDPDSTPTDPQAIGGAVERDRRFDVLRGLALFVIMFNHSSLIHVRIAATFDCADVFVFISGCVCGLAFLRVAVQQGFVGLLKKSWRRSAQLALSNALLAGLVLALACFGLLQLGLTSKQLFIGSLLNDPATGVLQAMTLRGQVGYLDILTLYVLLTAWLPVTIWLYLHNRFFAIAVSALLYVYGALGDHFGLPYSISFGFNLQLGSPFCWQLIFSIGVWIGIEYKRHPELVSPRRWMIWAAVVVLALSYALKFRPPDHFFYILTSKETVRPMRMMELLAVTCLVAAYLPASHRLWRWRGLSLFETSGRHSLSVYCAGVCLSYAAMMWARSHDLNPVSKTLGVITIIIALMLWALLTDRYQRWQRPRSTTPTLPAPENDAALTTLTDSQPTTG